MTCLEGYSLLNFDGIEDLSVSMIRLEGYSSFEKRHRWFHCPENFDGTFDGMSVVKDRHSYFLYAEFWRIIDTFIDLKHFIFDRLSKVS